MKISNEKLYEYSKSLDIYSHLLKKLKNFDIYRYSKFIDSSDLGIDCRYAKRTRQNINSEDAEFLELLSTFKQVSELYEKKYKEEILDEQEEEPKKRKRSCCN